MAKHTVNIKFVVPDFYPRLSQVHPRMHRVDRARRTTALLDHLNPLAVRYRDTLHMPGGEYPWTVCRVIINHASRTESYLCTNGERTRTIHEDEIFDARDMHYRDGERVHPLTTNR